MNNILETVVDVLKDSAIDGLKTLPFLFGVYLLIEYIERKGSDKLQNSLKNMGKFGAVGGSILGAVPQCGFSVVASNLYTGRLITMGTLVAVFLSTSDEALPILISNPDFAPKLWQLIIIKVIVGIVVGLIVDFVFRMIGRKQMEHPFEELCSDCDCEHHGIIHSAFHHTVGIFLFILVVNIILGCVMEFAGEETVKKLMMTDSFFQPLIAALVGFVPNCAASVILTQLYVENVMSFGSLVAGLCTGAGLGLLVLFKTNKHYKENFVIMGILYASAVIAGFAVNIIM